MIISFSGIDSAGKTTQINLLCAELEKRGLKYKKKWSKARGTPIVVFLKELVRKDKGMNHVQKSEHRQEVFRNPRKLRLLYTASMLDLCLYWGIHYRFQSLFCKYLICDRYLWDTYVEVKHDFVGIDIDRSFLWKMVKFFAPCPKVSFVFIIPAELSLARDKQKNAAGIEDIERKKSKINAYLKLVKEGRWTNVMDGTRTREDLHEEVKQIVGLK